MQRTNLAAGKNGPKTIPYLRVTGALSVAFQARSGGQTLAANNITSKYDEEFDSNGNDASHGVMGSMKSAWHRFTGSATSEDLDPPTEPELRSKLLTQAVREIAQHLVTTNETVEVLLAKGKKLDEGNKQAQAGLWQRALETYETAPQMSKPTDDAYRLYDIGVAYEALAYAAEDEKSAMKFLDEAAINYGKAIDDKPAEKNFVAPQKRIETAIAHYRELAEQRRPHIVAAEAVAVSKPAASVVPQKGLTNAQVVAMVKSGMEDDTIVQAVRAAKSASFDLSSGAQQELASNGVSEPVIAAMKARAARKAAAASHDDGCSGPKARLSHHDVEVFLGAEVGGKAAFIHHIVSQSSCHQLRQHRAGAVCNVGERASMDDRRRSLRGLDKVGQESVVEQRHHRSRYAQVSGSHSLSVAGNSDDNRLEPAAQIGSARRESENGHHLRRGGDHEAGRAVGALVSRFVVLTGAHDNMAKGAVVHIQRPPPSNLCGIEIELVSEVER
jgi:tetratricopeptide (TPR) repeat protein